ncbi:metallophosphoesterase [Pontibacter rugosus]|uniref:Metallophosphoesterase n=1 Tax=Pontibacter rugosus TaxID=1745966 RepID=A0ABW3SQP4_9BACT
MKKNYLKWILGGLTVSAAAVLLDSLILEKYFFDIQNYTIGKQGGKDKLKLILLTDLHFKKALLPHHHKLANTVNELKPDLILITGDTLDSTGELQPMEEFFTLLNPATAKVAIPGNNDYRADASIEQLKQVYQRHNCDLLINESKAYTLRGHRLMVTGLDDFIEGESNTEAALVNVGNEEYHILLVHSPLQQESAMKQVKVINQNRAADDHLNISYIFAGHNHGGQIRLPGYVPKLPNKSGSYVNGWYNDSPPYLYVSRGFGTSTLPLRFFARAEVTVFKYTV